MSKIYLDYNATTPIDPRVLEAMLPYFQTEFGNPSSTHALGLSAARAVQIAREQVASLIGASASEIVFTGGGSEASNHAIKGSVFARRKDWSSAHLIISAIEHPATAQPCHYLRSLGCELSIVPVDGTGLVDPDAIRREIRPTTCLISIMHSNNELGTLQPIKAIAAIARQHEIRMHVDAAQSLGKLPVDVKDLDIDFLTIAGHKLYAPKGVGALYIRRGIEIPSLIHGAGHEHGKRAGTENVPYIVGLGRAAELAEYSFPEATMHLRSLRDHLEDLLCAALDERVYVNGHPELRLPNTLNISFLGQIGAELLASIPDIAASTGAACHEGKHLVSPIFQAIGAPEFVGQGAVRLSVGRFTTLQEVERAAELLINAVRSNP